MRDLLPGVVGRTFDLMEVAEEEIARAGDRPGLFLLLCPPPSLVGLHPDVYRSHCRELIRKVGRGEDTTVATDAEVMAALSAMSLASPLSATATALYEELFRQVTGRKVDGPAAREPWKGAKRELLEEMRRRLGTRER